MHGCMANILQCLIFTFLYIFTILCRAVVPFNTVYINVNMLRKDSVEIQSVNIEIRQKAYNSSTVIIDTTQQL